MAEQGERSLEGGSYEVIRRRLLERATELSTKAEALNQKRKALFGGGELTLTATERVRTENNCTPRDVVSVDGQLLFGFQVFIGLKTETKVADVVSLFRFQKTPQGYDLTQQPFEGPGAFLADAEFDKLMREKYGISSVYYAHAGAGELHTRPLFDLKTQEGMKFFRGIATDVAHLVKKYRGSLSGEHGDGRLRGEFIPFMVGPECYAMMRRVKRIPSTATLRSSGVDR